MRGSLLILVVVACTLAAACTRTPAYLYGQPFPDLQFHWFSANMGIHPDQSVLSDPNNPFAYDPPIDHDPTRDHAKWDIQTNANPVVAFYSWATLDVLVPGGENQFYAALNLQAIDDKGLADADNLPKVKPLAIRAYQSVLDNFPTSVTYFDGKNPSDLATPSYKAILMLGGMPQGGWELVGPPENQRAVRP